MADYSKELQEEILQEEEIKYDNDDVERELVKSLWKHDDEQFVIVQVLSGKSVTIIRLFTIKMKNEKVIVGSKLKMVVIAFVFSNWKSMLGTAPNSTS